MLTFTLKKEWFEKIKSGEKTIEYREVKPYWDKRIYNEVKRMFLDRYGDKKTNDVLPDVSTFVGMYKNDPVIFGDESDGVIWDCTLRLGYTSQYMTAKINKVEVIDGRQSDLMIEGIVYAIHLTDVKMGG